MVACHYAENRPLQELQRKGNSPKSFAISTLKSLMALSTYLHLENDYTTTCLTVTKRQLWKKNILSFQVGALISRLVGKARYVVRKIIFSTVIDKQEETLEKSLNMCLLCTEEKGERWCVLSSFQQACGWHSTWTQRGNPVSKPWQ